MSYTGGSPDLFLFYKAKVMALEFKNPVNSGQISDKQQRIITMLTNMGTPVLVSNDFVDIVEKIKTWKQSGHLEEPLKIDEHFLDNMVMPSGIHRGKTFGYVRKTHLSYADWAFSQRWFQQHVGNKEKQDDYMFI
jgi:hypothetical protein